MTGRYHQGRVARRWLAAWDEANVYQLDDTVDRPCYVLGMFPYTSGSIHMGHVRNYSITDAYARFRRMQGDEVLHPIGWDAFGLPAENAAHEHGSDPATWTEECIAEMRDQLRDLGLGYDWSREISTCEPGYYRWNQWLFKQFYEADLVEYKEGTVNWCPDCETVLADAQVEVEDEVAPRSTRPITPGGQEPGVCWRCGTPVQAKSLPQWFFRITAYADDLDAGLATLDGWPESVRDIQRHWIGRQDGAFIAFELSNGETVDVFSARVDTIFGATYLAISPEHPLASTTDERPDGSIQEDRWWGVPLDITATHPLTGQQLPVWVAGYVLPDVGTGAIMGVPAHDERDFAFASEHGLDVRSVIQLPIGDGDLPVTEDGTLVDSDTYSELSSAEAREQLEAEPAITSGTTYRLRDWLISRQRYWGTPIPVIHCPDCGPVLVPDSDLPVTLPPFEPSLGNPLAASESFVQTTCPDCGTDARRETDTMDTFVDSSWYFLRYLSPRLSMAPYDVERANEALPVDLYVGGEEHATLHLLYLRFVAHALADLGLLSHPEPIERLVTQGMVLHGGQKMSKSVGNVVSPHEYGSETTRLFVLSAAHPARSFEWTDADVTHAYELQQDLYKLVADFDATTGRREDTYPRDRYVEREIDRTIAAATTEYSRLRFHQAISEVDQLASLLRRYRSYASPNRYTYERGLRILTGLIAPITPFLAEEMWAMLGESGLAAESTWPSPLRDVDEYQRERTVINRLRRDVREIIDVAGIDNPTAVEVVIAADWKFEAYALALNSPDTSSFFEGARTAGIVGADDDGTRQTFLEHLAGDIHALEQIVPAERERALLERSAWLIDDEFDVDVTIGQEGDDAPQSPEARPNRPGITIE